MSMQGLNVAMSMDSDVPETLSIDRLVEEVRARRADFDTLGHVPRDMIARMKAAGIFRSSTPAMFGGDTLPPAEFLRMVEAVATADGSAAWVAAFGSANSYLAALPVETQRIIYSQSPDQVFAGGLYPLQKAERVPGGVKVSGRWKFASGCKGADWIGVGIALDEPLSPSDAPGTTYMAVCPASEVEIIDSWDVVGMQGTGSHDTCVVDKFYPLEWICARGGRGQIDEPLYNYPALSYQAQVHAAVNLGLARTALDTIVSMSGAAKIMPGALRLCDRPYYRSALAKGEASLRSARAFFYEAAERAWDIVDRGDPLPTEAENLLRLSASHAAHASAEVIQSAYRVAGMSAIHKSSHLQQVVRDAMVVTQHAALGDSTFEAAGALLAGLPREKNFP
eukprot:TRINITY_DN3551_c0_g1_i4.p2 TRINITY_DN3551_c0_g1~~TRINITY_DN3551_c0_g1_i4.p2  ORF type:complete len:394 (-),score=65.73 TRINITY_DN3551_c0_g1_i4:560-1741(-)